MNKNKTVTRTMAVAALIGLGACSPRHEAEIYRSDHGLVAYDPFVSSTIRHELTTIYDTNHDGIADCVVISAGQTPRTRPHVEWNAVPEYAAAQANLPSAQRCAQDTGVHVFPLDSVQQRQWTDSLEKYIR